MIKRLDFTGKSTMLIQVCFDVQLLCHSIHSAADLHTITNDSVPVFLKTFLCFFLLHLQVFLLLEQQPGTEGTVGFMIERSWLFIHE